MLGPKTTSEIDEDVINDYGDDNTLVLEDDPDDVVDDEDKSFTEYHGYDWWDD